MVNLKKMVALSLSAVLAFSITACGDKKTETTDKTENAKTVASVDDLKGAKIGVQLGTTGDSYVSDYEKDGSTIERYNKGADAVQALKQGKIDCVVIDSEPAKAFVEKNSDLKILDEPFETEEYAICISKDKKDLTEKINAALKELKADGTLDKSIQTISAMTQRAKILMYLPRAQTAATASLLWQQTQLLSLMNSMKAIRLSA